MRSEQKTRLGRIIQRASLFAGAALIIISMYLSYDGFDGTVGTEATTAASMIAKLIGWTLAAVVCVVQFVFTNEYKKLNPTLILAGLLTYAYSIWTNKMGATNILGMSESMSWTLAAMSDILAEPLVSYGLGESLVGDLLGNMWKIAAGEEKKNEFVNQPREKSTYKPKHKPQHMIQQNKQNRRPPFPVNQSFSQESRGNGNRHTEKPDIFGGFG